MRGRVPPDVYETVLRLSEANFQGVWPWVKTAIREKIERDDKGRVE